MREGADGPGANREEKGLQRYVHQLLAELGAAVSPAGPGLIEAVVPPELADLFGGRSYVKLAFDYEAQREAGDAEFVRPGSSLLDGLAEAGLALGRLLCRSVWLSRVAVPERMEERIAKAIEFANGRAFRVSGVRLVELGYVAFQWRAALVSDERREWAERTLVDLQRGLPSDGLEALERSVWEKEVSHVLPSASRVSLHDACQAAYRVARARGERRLEEYERKTRSLKQSEVGKINQYYDGLNQQLRRRMERASDEEKRRELAQRLQANEADRRRRLEDVERKYRPVLELAVDQAVWYRVPGVEASVEVLVQRTWFPLPVHYNLATHSVEPLGCRQCGRRLRAVFVGRDGQVACQEHAGTGRPAL